MNSSYYKGPTDLYVHLSLYTDDGDEQFNLYKVPNMQMANTGD